MLTVEIGNMLSIDVLIAGAMMVSLTFYALLGGADFGGGVWDMFASGPRKQAQRDLIAEAIGPVWEANHVWLILVVVLLFTAFPPAFAAVAISLHIPLGQDGDGEFGDLIEDSEAVQPGEAVSFTLLQEQLQSVLGTLSEREAGVVSMRFGLTDGQPKTLDEIGKVYGVTRERIRQIESKAMSKLRHPSRSNVLRDYLD